MPRVPPEYRIVLQRHQRQLERLVRRRGAAQMKKLYDQATDELMRKLARQAGRGGATFTTTTRRSLLMQLRSGMIQLTQRLKGELGEASLAAQVESVRTLARSVSQLERKFTGAIVTLPVEEAGRFAGVVDKGRSSLLRAHDTSMARYGASLVRNLERDMATSLLTGQTTSETIDRLRERTDLEWYQGERIVRTEMAWAYNASQADAIEDATKIAPDLMMRWNEHVSEGGTPLDDRVGDDSIAMHGQVAPAGGVFTMPPRTKAGVAISSSLVGDAWSHPPNRPNDRAVLAPWRPHWGVPGWVWKGRRVPVG